MGYSTDFYGTLKLNKKLKKADLEFLKKFNEIRHMARKVDPKYGVEGEFYLDGTWDPFRPGNPEPDILNGNKPPSTQPGLWCQWRPTDDGKGIEWDGGEKFYNYVEWLQYLIEAILKPRGYVLNGEVSWTGEEDDDRGTITVTNNQVETLTNGEVEEMHEALLKNILGRTDMLPTLMGLNHLLDRKIREQLKTQSGQTPVRA